MFQIEDAFKKHGQGQVHLQLGTTPSALTYPEMEMYDKLLSLLNIPITRNKTKYT